MMSGQISEYETVCWWCCHICHSLSETKRVTEQCRYLERKNIRWRGLRLTSSRSACDSGDPVVDDSLAKTLWPSKLQWQRSIKDPAPRSKTWRLSRRCLKNSVGCVSRWRTRCHISSLWSTNCRWITWHTFPGSRNNVNSIKTSNKPL